MTDNSLDRKPEILVLADAVRRCPMCKVEKSESEFYRNPKTGAFRAYCPPCYRKWNNAKYGQRRAHLLAYHKKNRAADPEKYKTRRKESYKRNKEQERAGNRERYRKNRDGMLAYAKQYREKNKDQMKARWFYNKYRITKEQYDNLVRSQGGVCAVCLKPEDKIIWQGIPQRLSVDHDHACCKGDRSCGKCIRGLLCSSCNSALGYMKDDESRLVRAVEYIRKWKS